MISCGLSWLEFPSGDDAYRNRNHSTFVLYYVKENAENLSTFGINREIEIRCKWEIREGNKAGGLTKEILCLCVCVF